MRSCILLGDPTDSARLAGLRLRLRSAVIEPFDAVRYTPGNPGTLAGLLVGNTEAIASLLGDQIPVLLVADPVPEWSVLEPLLDRARSTGTPLALVNPERFLPSRRLIHEQLHRSLGAPGLLRVHRWIAANEMPRTVAGLPEPLLRDLDVAVWLFGRMPERVHAVRRSLGDAAGESLLVHLGFSAGGMALLDVTVGLPAGDGYQSLSVIAASGAAYADGHTNSHRLLVGGPARTLAADESAGQLAAIAQDFVDALLADRTPAPGSRTDWARVFALARAVTASLQSGQAHAVEEVVA